MRDVIPMASDKSQFGYPPMYGRPDWVLLGVPNGIGVTVFGSLEMTEAELRAERELPLVPVGRFDMLEPGTTRYFISAQMKTFTMAHGETYAAALSVLFGYWDADARRDPARMPPALRPPALDRSSSGE